MARKKKQPAAFDLADVPVPPIRAGADSRSDLSIHPAEQTGKQANLDDTIIFDRCL